MLLIDLPTEILLSIFELILLEDFECLILSCKTLYLVGERLIIRHNHLKQWSQRQCKWLESEHICCRSILDFLENLPDGLGLAIEAEDAIAHTTKLELQLQRNQKYSKPSALSLLPRLSKKLPFLVNKVNQVLTRLHDAHSAPSNLLHHHDGELLPCKIGLVAKRTFPQFNCSLESTALSVSDSEWYETELCDSLLASVFPNLQSLVINMDWYTGGPYRFRKLDTPSPALFQLVNFDRGDTCFRYLRELVIQDNFTCTLDGLQTLFHLPNLETLVASRLRDIDKDKASYMHRYLPWPSQKVNSTLKKLVISDARASPERLRSFLEPLRSLQFFQWQNAPPLLNDCDRFYLTDYEHDDDTLEHQIRILDNRISNIDDVPDVYELYGDSKTPETPDIGADFAQYCPPRIRTENEESGSDDDDVIDCTGHGPSYVTTSLEELIPDTEYRWSPAKMVNETLSSHKGRIKQLRISERIPRSGRWGPRSRTKPDALISHFRDFTALTHLEIDTQLLRRNLLPGDVGFPVTNILPSNIHEAKFYVDEAQTGSIEAAMVDLSHNKHHFPHLGRFEFIVGCGINDNDKWRRIRDSVVLKMHQRHNSQLQMLAAEGLAVSIKLDYMTHWPIHRTNSWIDVFREFHWVPANLYTRGHGSTTDSDDEDGG